MRKIIYIVVLSSAVLLMNCKKETVQQVSRMDLLTGRKWQLDKLLYSVKDEPKTLDFTSAAYRNCELDDVYEFNKNGIFTRSDGLTRCGNIVLHGPYGTSNWVADSALTKLDIELFTRYSYKLKVIALSDTQLQLERATTNYLQQDVLYTFYFKSAN